MDFYNKLMATTIIDGFTVGTVFTGLVIFLVCLLAQKIILHISAKTMERAKIDKGFKSFIQKVGTGVLWIITAIIVCDAVGISTSSLVALFSVAGLAVSLALQDSLSNMTSGAMLLSLHPFKAGDFVEAGGQEGTVRDVGVFYTQLRTVDNKVVLVPNSSITKGKIVNYTAASKRRIEVKVCASYDDRPGDVLAALRDAAHVEGVLADPAPVAVLLEYQASAIQYSLRAWAPNEIFWDVQFEINKSIGASFKKFGVHMSYNHVNVHIVEDKAESK